MDKSRTEDLAANYATWSSERLIVATTTERSDYCKDALELMFTELQKRGITDQDMLSSTKEMADVSYADWSLDQLKATVVGECDPHRIDMILCELGRRGIDNKTMLREILNMPGVEDAAVLKVLHKNWMKGWLRWIVFGAICVITVPMFVSPNVASWVGGYAYLGMGLSLAYGIWLGIRTNRNRMVAKQSQIVTVPSPHAKDSNNQVGTAEPTAAASPSVGRQNVDGQ